MITLQSIAPGFLSDVASLHDLLIIATFVAAFIGLTVASIRGMQGGGLMHVPPALITTTLAAMLATAGLVQVTETLRDIINGVVSQTFGQNFPGAAFTAYDNALKIKFGTTSVGAAAQILNGGNTGAAIGPAQNTTGSGLHLTHYAYEQPGNRNYDSKSAAGIGAFGFDTAPGSLNQIGALRAVALSPDVAAAYNVQPGQSFQVQAGGEQFTFVYADQTDPSITNVIDVFDPGQELGSMDGAAVTGFNGTVVAQASPTSAGPNPVDMLLHPGDVLWSMLMRFAVWVLSMIALMAMIGMGFIQAFLYQIELAISPIFCGLMCIQGLRPVATRFFLKLAGLLMWPFGWVIASLVTTFLVNLALGVTDQNPGSLTLSSTNPGSWFLWGMLAIWVIGSSIVAPLLASRMFVDSASGVIVMLGATLGRTASTVVAPVTTGVSRVTTNTVAQIASGGANGAGFRPNYEVRPQPRQTA